MRPNTSISRNKLLQLQSKSQSMAILHDLKKSTQRFPSLKNQVGVTQINRGMKEERKSNGKLHLGNIAKPIMILSKDQRLNPWAKRTIISEQILSKKGLLNLVHMGVIAKQYDCLQLLNNRYELTQQPPPSPSLQQKIYQQHKNTHQDKNGFMTNPAIIDAYYQQTKKNQIQEEIQDKSKQQIQQKVIKKKRTSTKKKVVKQEQSKFEFIIQERVQLNVLNFNIQKNQQYLQYMKRLKRNGLEHVFKIYGKKIQEFAMKYNLKKLTFVPDLNQSRKITEKSILSSIMNHKLFGIDLRVKGNPLQIFRMFFLMKIQKIRYKNTQASLKKIERVKNTFRIKKFYREMVEQRWKLINFKFGSFAQSQRRLLAEHSTIPFKPEVEIHILAFQCNWSDLQTYYKWRQRRKAQLTRLYNNEADHLILILNHQQNLQDLLTDIQGLELGSGWKKPNIHIFYSSLPSAKIQEYGEIYFGLKPRQIKQIKKICNGRASAVIPYGISPYLPKICQVFGARLFAGTFAEESISLLAEEEQVEEGGVGVQGAPGAKFKRLILNSKELNQLHALRMKRIRLSNEVFSSKRRIKDLFVELEVPTPVWLSIAQMNQWQFFQELVRMMLREKGITRWVLKLPESTFSRGLAWLQTQALKVIKQAKKKTFVRQEEISQIARIIESILVQKIAIPHSSLLNGDEFLSLFKQRQGYIQASLDNTTTICLFGRIETTGTLTLLGSCKKYYAENVCFGCLYPALDLTEEMITHSQRISSYLFSSGVFGYINFQLLFNDKSKIYHFIGVTPHLNEYSSFYFYYKRILDINNIQDGKKFINKMKRCLFYCPFIDNNGNHFKSITAMKQRLLQRKLKFDDKNLEGFKYLYLSQDIPEVVSVVAMSGDEGGAIKHCLQALRFLVDNGGEFNKFDKKYKNNQTDGLYIMDILWKMRQLKKQKIDK